MLARHRQVFASGVFALDAVLIAGSWLGAYALRFHALPAPLGVPSLSFYLWFGAVLTPVALLVLRTFKIYRSARTARLSQELLALAQGMIIVGALAALASYFTKGELSRGFLAVFVVVATVAQCGSRVVIRGALRGLRRGGRNLRHTILVGTGDVARLMIEKIHRHADFGLHLQGLVATDLALVGETIHGHEVIGAISDLPRVVETRGVDLVYLALPRQEWQAEEEALRLLADSTAAVRLVPDLRHAFRLNPSVEDFDGMPVVLVTDSPEQGWNAVLKRGFDLVCSTAGLLLLWPVLLAIAVLVKLDSPGPVFYAQERVGLNGRRFRMIKFRSMRVDAEARGAGWTTKDDPRRTRFGEVLRRLSLDELPQLWNVLVGDMSLVGPRPERPVYVDQFRASIPRYMLRHHVRAGLTGWAQVNGLRGDTPLERRIEYDLYYVKNWSLALDVRILLLTFARVFRDGSAY
ncbi:MAG: undecaprenyl-phosphate glucose phosphotransferase [Candidatus Eisenbacteria bacterium]|uniref:Undecaprenyl-phosphate glucose phosphotransferase n=1 Tax=Eiseniibacteriota bacterium TaxID=2212470 RepID=A0A538UAX0_UNCEI|nr:MAG: undecaprenyl-phosphate glucose phosphotransferase [Candidatus Eisenbacteria bacterium]